jgi:hypothetical protein
MALAGAFAPGLAHAGILGDTVTATLNTVIPYNFPSVVLDGSTSAGGVGEIVWSVTNAQAAANPAPFNASFNTFCIDIPQDIYFGDAYTFTVTTLANSPNTLAYPAGNPNAPGPMGTTKADEMQTVYNDYATAGQSNDTYAAFQVSLWNILYDSDATIDPNAPVGTGGYQGGYFHVAPGQFDSTVITDADNWIADAIAHPAASVTNLVGLVGSGDTQDQMYIGTTGAINTIVTSEVPLPSVAGTGMAMLAGLGLFAGLRRRNLRPVTA